MPGLLKEAVGIILPRARVAQPFHLRHLPKILGDRSWERTGRTFLGDAVGHECRLVITVDEGAQKRFVDAVAAAQPLRLAVDADGPAGVLAKIAVDLAR